MNQRIFAPAALAAALAAAAGHALAAPRTFVASYGNDGNPCTLAQPCRSFGAAIAQTNPGGEVIALDSAGYGPVTVNQSVSIVAPGGVYAGVAVTSGTGISVNAANIVVVLRGLSINGVGGTTGIDFADGKELHVEGCIVHGFGGPGGAGISHTNANGALHLKDSEVRHNAIGLMLQGPAVRGHIDHARFDANGTGVAVRDGAEAFVDESVATKNGTGLSASLSNGASVTSHLAVARTLVTGNVDGVSSANANAAGAAQALVDVVDSLVSGNSRGAVVDGAGGPATLVAVRDFVTRNGNLGIGTAAGGTTLAMIDDVVTENNIGVATVAGSTLLTNGNNTDDLNTTNSNLNGTTIALNKI